MGPTESYLWRFLSTRMEGNANNPLFYDNTGWQSLPNNLSRTFIERIRQKKNKPCKKKPLLPSSKEIKPISVFTLILGLELDVHSDHFQMYFFIADESYFHLVIGHFRTLWGNETPLLSLNYFWASGYILGTVFSKRLFYCTDIRIISNWIHSDSHMRKGIHFLSLFKENFYIDFTEININLLLFSINNKSSIFDLYTLSWFKTNLNIISVFYFLPKNISREECYLYAIKRAMLYINSLMYMSSTCGLAWASAFL